MGQTGRSGSGEASVQSDTIEITTRTMPQAVQPGMSDGSTDTKSVSPLSRCCALSTGFDTHPTHVRTLSKFSVVLLRRAVVDLAGSRSRRPKAHDLIAGLQYSLAAEREFRRHPRNLEQLNLVVERMPLPLRAIAGYSDRLLFANGLLTFSVVCWDVLACDLVRSQTDVAQIYSPRLYCRSDVECD